MCKKKKSDYVNMYVAEEHFYVYIKLAVIV